MLAMSRADKRVVHILCIGKETETTVVEKIEEQAKLCRIDAFTACNIPFIFLKRPTILL